MDSTKSRSKSRIRAECLNLSLRLKSSPSWSSWATHQTTTMVSVSPRMRDSLDFEEPEAIDPRLSHGFQSMSFESGDSDHDSSYHQDDIRPRSRGSDPTTRKKKRQRHIKSLFGELAEHEFKYETVADGDVFRLIELAPGIGTEVVSCRLFYQSWKKPEHEYTCLSYCWETTVRDEYILCNDRRFAVTTNLLSALRNIRSRTSSQYIWVDQVLSPLSPCELIDAHADAKLGRYVSIKTTSKKEAIKSRL